MKEMTSKSNVNTIGLLKHAEEKKKAAITKVDLAIKTIIKNEGNVNFNAVSKIAGVSKSYLYKNNEIRERIEILRKQTEISKTSKTKKRILTESSKDVIITAKNNKIKELNAENKYLKEQLMILRGKLYDSI